MVPPDLSEQSVNQFWEFVCERQRIWQRRVVHGSDPPWTTDGALQRYRFTNVYRVLDPGTQYVIQEVLERDESKPDKIFNVMLYRLIGRQETHQVLGFRRLADFDPDRFERDLKHRRDQQNQPVFTGAYRVSGYTWMGSTDKIENVTAIFDRIASSAPEAFEEIIASSTMHAAYDVIHSFPGFGEFLSYQVLVDLLYPLACYNDQSLLPFSHDDWVQPGPGAKNGINVLCGATPDIEPTWAVRWLRENQRDEFNRLAVEFPYLTSPTGSIIELSLTDLQNCLCEFYKYDRVRQKNGRARRRFRPEESRTPEELRELYEPASIHLTTRE